MGAHGTPDYQRRKQNGAAERRGQNSPGEAGVSKQVGLAFCSTRPTGFAAGRSISSFHSQTTGHCSLST